LLVFILIVYAVIETFIAHCQNTKVPSLFTGVIVRKRNEAMSGTVKANLNTNRTPRTNLRTSSLCSRSMAKRPEIRLGKSNT
jgi:hypothetical protein